MLVMRDLGSSNPSNKSDEHVVLLFVVFSFLSRNHLPKGNVCLSVS